MSYFAKTDDYLCKQISITNPVGGDIDIICTTGNVKINGIVPINGGGGGGILPPDVNGTGDLTTQGNITATGDGISNGKIVGQTITSTDNIVITDGSLEVTTGGIDIKGNGDLDIEGNGNISVLGTGNIGVGIGGITSVGDIQTSTGDIVSAGDFIFEGDDIKFKTYDPVAFTSYVQYKQLPQLNASNTFTGANKFNDNVTEFAEKVSVGTRDAQGLFTQTIALNKSGNIESQTIQNVTSIQTGTLNCGNGATNSCAAKTFTTRTSGLAGWNIEQQVASVPADPYDNVLNFKAGQVGGFITITDSVGSFTPNIVLDPKTPALGGLIKTTTFEVGDGGLAYKLTQPVTGTDSDNLLIKSNSAASECIFQDETSAAIMNVKKTEVQLGNTIPLSFGAYSFRPIQYSSTIASFPIEQNANAFTKIFTSISTWTNVNTGATGQSITEGFYKLSVSQTGASTPAGNYEGIGILCDFVYIIPADSLPNNQLPNPLSFSYKKYLTTGAPQIEIRRNATGGQDVHLTFPTSATGGESMPITVKLTKMDF